MSKVSVAASAYDIRFSTSIKQLRSSFDNASRLNDTDILAGNITSPLASSETETFVIRFPTGYNNRTLFFGLKVIHSNTNRVSKVSNIVSAALVYVPPDYVPTTSEPETTAEDTTTWEPTTEPQETTTDATTTSEPETTAEDTTTWEPTTEPQETTTDATTTVEQTTEPDETTTLPTTTMEQTTPPEDTTASATTTLEPATEEPDTTTETTPPTQQQPRTGSSEKAVFAIKLSFGIAIPLMFLIAIPLMIRSVRRGRNNRGTKPRERYSKGESPFNDYCEPPVNVPSALPYSVPRANRPMGPRYARDATTCYLPQTNHHMEQGYNRGVVESRPPQQKRPMGPRYVRATPRSYLPQTNHYQQRIYENSQHKTTHYNGANFHEPKPDYY